MSRDTTLVTIRGKQLKLPAVSTKADAARALLELGYNVNEISKAVPMAYSQVHSIAKALGKVKSVAEHQAEAAAKPKQQRIAEVREHRKAYNKANNMPEPVVARTKETVKAARAAQADVDRILRREKANADAGLPVGTGAKYSRVGKLRTGGLPRDVEVGECANCGFDLVVRQGPQGWMLVHVNISAEDYLAVIQFCQAVPKKLL